MKVKKMLFPIFFAVLLGSSLGYLVSFIYENKTNQILDSTKLYLVQTGAYSSVDSMQVNSNLANYIYYNDEGLYKTVVAITKDISNVDKIKQVYSDVIVKEYYLDNNTINNEIINYDKQLKETNNKEEIESILSNMLNFYKNNNNLVLSKKS